MYKHVDSNGQNGNLGRRELRVRRGHMPRHRSIVAVAVVVVLGSTSALAQKGARNGEWRSHGGDTGHIQYAALDQINKDNLRDLEIVWRWASVDAALREQHDELQARSARIFFHEVTPLKVGDTLYASTSLGQIAAGHWRDALVG